MSLIDWQAIRYLPWNTVPESKRREYYGNGVHNRSYDFRAFCDARAVMVSTFEEFSKALDQYRLHSLCYYYQRWGYANGWADVDCVSRLITELSHFDWFFPCLSIENPTFPSQPHHKYRLFFRELMIHARQQKKRLEIIDWKRLREACVFDIKDASDFFLCIMKFIVDQEADNDLHASEIFEILITTQELRRDSLHSVLEFTKTMQRKAIAMYLASKGTLCRDMFHHLIERGHQFSFRNVLRRLEEFIAWKPPRQTIFTLQGAQCEYVHAVHELKKCLQTYEKDLQQRVSISSHFKIPEIDTLILDYLDS